MEIITINDRKYVKRKTPWHKRKESVYGFTTAFLPFLGFIIFVCVPLVLAFVLAFNDVSNYSFDKMTYVGFDNFAFVLKDPLFWKSAGNTALNCLVTPLSMAVGLIISLIVSNTKLVGKTIFKAIFFLPYVCSVVATTIIWKYMLNSEYGLVNQLLSVIGITGPDWLGDPNWVMPTMIFLGVWSGMGFSIIMYTAALTTVDSNQIEAAYLEGANAWKRFWKVTFPSIMPITFFLFVTGIIGNLQDFARFQALLPGGGPNSSGLTIVYYLYTKGWTEIITYGMGVASAASWILAIIIMIVTVFQFMVNKKQGDNTK